MRFGHSIQWSQEECGGSCLCNWSTELRARSSKNLYLSSMSIHYYHSKHRWSDRAAAQGFNSCRQLSHFVAYTASFSSANSNSLSTYPRLLPFSIDSLAESIGSSNLIIVFGLPQCPTDRTPVFLHLYVLRNDNNTSNWELSSVRTSV